MLSRGLVIALALWGSCVIAPEFARVFGDYATLGFVANNDGLITAVSGPPATDPGADVHVGDCIDLQRTSLEDRLAVFGGMGNMTYVRPGLVATLYIEPGPCTPGAAAATARTLAAQIKGITVANRLVLFIDQVLGLFFIGLAAVLVWQRPSTMTWGFFLYAIWFNPGQFFVFYAELQRWPAALLIQQCLQAVAQALGYAGFVLFALRFPHDTLEPRWRPIERKVLPAVTVAILALSLLSFGTTIGLRSETFSRWSYGVGYLVDIGVLLILRARRKQQRPEDEQRTRWVHWGCRVGLAAFIFADSNMATTWWDPIWTPFCTSGGWLAAVLCDGDALSETTLLSVFLVDALLALAVFHAVRRHRIINVSFAVSRGTTLILTWLIIAAVFTWATIAIEHVLHSISMQFLWYFVAILVIKVTFEWLHERLNEGCDRIFFRRLHVAEQRFARLHAELRDAKDLDDIDRRMTDDPVRILDLASAAVFRGESAGAYSRHVASIGWPSQCDDVTLPRATLDRLLQGRQAPVHLNASTLHVSMPTGTAQPIVAVPVFGAAGIAAVALYGAHRAGDDLTQEEYQLLHDLSAAAGVAYSRIETLQLREQVHALTQKLAQLPCDHADYPKPDANRPSHST